MKIPVDYISDSFGVRTSSTEDGFNQIVFTAWYHFARLEKGEFNDSDLDALVAHLMLNKDKDGLYKLKNSHDNVTYKMLLSQKFDLQLEDSMSFIAAVKQIGFFRIWDVILYWFVFGPKYLRWLARPLLWIPALQMIEATANSGKIRPKWFEKEKHKRPDQRFYWWLLPKTKMGSKMDDNGLVEYTSWKDYKGKTRVTRQLQNDGKHLSLFKLYGLKDRSWTLKLTAKICRYLFRKRYGDDYAHGVLDRYFSDRNHPVPPLWKGYGDIL